MGLLFQCLGITGIILIFYGLLAFAITQASTWFFWTILGVGGACLVAFLGSFIQRIYLGRLSLKSIFKSRSLQHGTSSIVYSVLVIGIIVVANVQSSKFFNFKKDFTENRVNTLTDQSIKIIQKLKEPLKVFAFFDERNQVKPVLKDLLKMYEAQSDQVEVQFVDPDKEKVLAEKYGATDGDVVVDYKEQTHVTQAPSEEGITQAIMKVSRTKTPTVCFTKGHGELDIDGSDEETRSLSAAKGGMENEGYSPKGIESVTEDSLKGCEIVVVAGPTQKFTNSEAVQLDQFLEKGGKGVFLLDPHIPDSRLSSSKLSVLDTGLEDLTSKWGAKIGKNFVLEKHLTLFRGVNVDLNVQARRYGDHPIVDPLKGRNTVFDRLRSVNKEEGFSGTAVELVFSASGTNSWAESDVDSIFRTRKVAVDERDIQGPVPIGVASEKGEGDKKTQLVVLGDSDFVSNGMVRSFEFNYDFFLNTLNWLSGEVEQISIRPKKIRTSKIELTASQSNTIFYVAIVSLPMLVLVFGLNLWWIRRRRG